MSRATRLRWDHLSPSPPGGREDAWPTSPLVRDFKEFFALLAHLKERAEEDPWSLSPSTEGMDPEERAGPVAREIRGALRRKIRELGETATRRGGTKEGERFQEAAYVMAALVDEIFLTLPWVGKEAWLEGLLEAELFQTHTAGEQLFVRAEGLLTRGEDGDRDLAAVYLMALTLGFQGRYRGAADTQPLTDLKDRLLAFIMPSPPADESTDPLFEQPYAHIRAGRPDLRLPRTQWWAGAVVAALVLYVVASALVWRHVADPVRELTEEVRAGTLVSDGSMGEGGT